VDESSIAGLLRIPLSEFHNLEVARDYCSMGSALEEARKSTVMIEEAKRLEGRATWLWGRAILSLLRGLRGLESSVSAFFENKI
jgi:hypothetical protein